MADLLFVAITVAFFAVAAGFVRLCDTVIGPDVGPTPTPDGVGDAEPAEAVAMTADNVVGLAVAVLIVAYLVLTLVFPERF